MQPFLASKRFLQDLRYLEFFAGKGEVFTAVKAEHTAVAVDLEYLSGVGHAMDINSDSGLACFPCSQICEFNQ